MTCAKKCEISVCNVAFLGSVRMEEGRKEAHVDFFVWHSMDACMWSLVHEKRAHSHKKTYIKCDLCVTMFPLGVHSSSTFLFSTYETWKLGWKIDLS